MIPLQSMPRRAARLGPSDLILERKPTGEIYARSPHSLAEYPERMTDCLDHWAAHASYRTFLAERTPSGWRNITYAETQFFARRIGQALIDRGLSAERPLVIISGNDIEHALMSLGAIYAGIPYAPVSPGYSLDSPGFGELRQIFELVTPGMVFAANGRQYQAAIDAVIPPDAHLVVTEEPVRNAILFSALADTPAGPAIEHAYTHVHAGTVFKILFTPDSTGVLKGPINTHRMWATSQAMLRHHFAFLAEETPVTVDWLPWADAFGGNAALGLVLYNGGSLYIDDGKPERTLRRITPTLYWNDPEGFEALLPQLQNDSELARSFFRRLKLLYCTDAELAPRVWNDFAEISFQVCGERILMLTGLGSAETTAHVLLGLESSDGPGQVGVPAPGVELKLVPIGDGKFEARLRGSNVTAGYWRRPDLTRAAFDEERFFKLGVALRFLDESDPAKGFTVDGAG